MRVALPNHHTDTGTNQERKRVIDAYMGSYNTGQKIKVPFRGETRELQVIRVPTGDLRFNVQLGRLILDRLNTIEVGATVDPEDPDTQRELEQKILSLSKINILIEELRRNGQLEPGIITEDGYVINGNRRLASLRKLERETGDPRFRFMDVAVLPQAMPEDLFLLEANLQMSPETRARYGPVTTAIQVRRGLTEYQLSKPMVAEAMRLTADELQENLDILNLMDGYLAFIDQPGRYGLLEGAGGDPGSRQGKWWVFVEINNLQKQYKNDPRWEQFLRHLYVMVFNDASMDDIRSLKKLKKFGGINLYATEVAKVLASTGVVAPTPVTPPPPADPAVGKLLKALSNIQSTDSPSEDRLLKLRGPDAAQLSHWKDITSAAYNEALETISNSQAREIPQQLLSQALKKLESVDLAAAQSAQARAVGKRHFELSEVQGLLAKISTRLAMLIDEASRLKEV